MYDKKSEVLLKVENLRQYFPLRRGQFIRAVDDVSFEIKKGEVFGLVGESGCGKTTTGRSIIGLYEPTGGHIHFRGHCMASGRRNVRQVLRQERSNTAQNIRVLETMRDSELARNTDADVKELQSRYERQIRLEEEALAEFTKNYPDSYAGDEPVTDTNDDRRKMQMIFQDPIASINPRMTVREIIGEGLIVQGIRDKELIREKVYEVLEKVGLVREHADRYPHEFSGGQRQRIGIARAIIMEPELIIADEPISALDVSIQAQVINLLNELRESLGLTILFIAHNLSVVKYFSDRIAVMYFGRIVELADAEELFRHPFHPYTRSLLSAIPYPDPKFERKRKRIHYQPWQEHDYYFDKPKLTEIYPGHFVYCNEAEQRRYLQQLEAASPER